MYEGTIFGLDWAKRVSHVHGAKVAGGVALHKSPSGGQVLAFFAWLPRRTAGMGVYATGQYWAREIGALGHAVRLVPLAYVKSFVKRQ